MGAPIRFYIWPRYVLKANGKRIRLSANSKFALALALMVKAKGGCVSHERLIEAAYYGDEDGGPLYASECLRVAIYKMRRVLRRLDLDIVNHFDFGYRLVNRHH